MRGASHKDFNCEVVDKLADWDHLECRMQNLNKIKQLCVTEI
jgi:hypothetical protein